MKWRTLPLAGALTVLPALAAAFPVTAIQQAGPVTQRFNVVILGDGYTASEQAKLTSDAKALVSELFDGAPYQPYRQLFNFKVIQSVSQDSGAAEDPDSGAPNTLFGAYYDCEGVSQLICVNEAAVLSAAAADVPEFDLALVVVNDSNYGGSGGDVPVVSTDPDAAEILRHELGHTLGHLADEYSDPYPSYPPCSAAEDCTEPNVTLRNVRAQIKWLDWIDPSTPVPTTGFNGVGLFEGARYLSHGIYRPVDWNCKMQSLNLPFCPVCAEALVRAFWNLKNVHLIDDADPPGDLATSRCVDTTFSVKTPSITPSTLSVSWTVDNHPQAETSASLMIPAGALSAGAHIIVATVNDATTLVRSDPQGKLSEAHAFTYRVPDCTMGAGGAAGADTDGGAAGEGTTLPSAGGASAGAAHGGSGGRAGTAGTGGDVGAGAPSLSSGGALAQVPSPPVEKVVGCGCHVGEREQGHAWGMAMALLGAVGLLRRRRGERPARISI